MLIADPAVGDIPDAMARGHIVATRTAVAVGTLVGADGETEIVLTDERRPDPRVSGRPVFEGEVSTPSRRLCVMSTRTDVILETSVGSEATHLRIWTNDDSEPDLLVIAIERLAAGPGV